MNSSNVPAPAPTRPRRIWQWLLAATALCVGAASLAAFNLVTLTSDASALRDELTSVPTPSVRTQVQVTAGPLLLATLRTVAGAFDRIPKEAQLAFQAVRNVSVGVYQLRGPIGVFEQTRMLEAADQGMHARGWSRAVGVSERGNLVLVYLPERELSGSLGEVCVAVCSNEHLVVFSGAVRMDHLLAIATQQRLIARR